MFGYDSLTWQCPKCKTFYTISEEEREMLEEYLNKNQIINAMKEIRGRLGLSIHECMDLVDSYCVGRRRLAAETAVISPDDDIE